MVMIASDTVLGLTGVGFFSIWAKMLGATDMEIGTIVATGSLVMFLVQMPGGVLGVRFEKKKLYVFSLAVSFFTGLLIFMTKDWWWLLLAAIVENIGSIAAPALDALAASLANARLRLEPEQQLTLAEEIQAEGLSVKETRQRMRQILGKELSGT